MAQLLTKDGKLAVRDGQLLDDSCSADCCAGGEAVKFTECCDGDPVVWIIAALADGCATAKIGELCYANTGQRAALADLETAGVSVLRAFSAGDGCVSGCTDPRCRECPNGCCIRAYLPACRTDQPRRCCLLGSAYRIDYTERTDFRRWGFDCGQGGCVARSDGTCAGFELDPLEEWTRVITAHVTHAAEGVGCSGVAPDANRFFRRTGRIWIVDGYTPDAVPINGRYVDIDELSQDEVPHFARGEMPPPEYVATEELGPDGVPIGEACGITRTFLVCERVGTELDPCPSPSNPVVISRTITANGVWDCARGSQTVIEATETRSCPRASTVLRTFSERRTVREWTVTILSRVGCEVTSCEDAGPGVVGALIGPGGPCAGCRGEIGI